MGACASCSCFADEDAVEARKVEHEAQERCDASFAEYGPSVARSDSPSAMLHGEHGAHEASPGEPQAMGRERRRPQPPSSHGSEAECFHDALSDFEAGEVQALADAPFAFARHPCVVIEAAESARGQALLDGCCDEEAVASEKSEAVRQMEASAGSFDDSFWQGSGSSSGSAWAMLKTMFHLRNVDLSTFSGVPMSHHIPVSSCQILHSYSFMPGRVPPAHRFDAHLRAELPAVLQADPLSRFLAVLRCHIALLDAPAQCLNKPFNPVLGETSRIMHCLGACGSAPITGVCEQVSHHPPVTAFGSWDAELRVSYSGWVDIAPRFMGTHIRVPFTGHRQLKLHGAPGAGETYAASIPGMEWHFLPSVRAQYAGTWHLWCSETGLAAEVVHPSVRFLQFGGKRTRLHGRIARFTPGHAAPLDAFSDSPRTRAAACAATLATFDGDFDGLIHMQRLPAERHGGATVLWDARREAAMEGATAPAVHTPELERKPSEAVWGPTFAALADKAWDVARQRKEAVENAERRARKAREKAGLVWTPTWFVKDGGAWLPRA